VVRPFRALSSVWSERLPYKQDVGGSNPSAPTKRIRSDDGRIRWANPINEVFVVSKLGRQADGSWLITDRDWEFVPGKGP
jgi:hypothetical protein